MVVGSGGPEGRGRGVLVTAQVWGNTRFELVDPRALSVDRNSRTVADVEAEQPALCASVRKHGVRVPIIVRPVPEGGYRVLDGHCRTLIAVGLGERCPVVPVIVTESADEREWVWLRDQWLANEVRSGYGGADTARIFEQLTLSGLTVERVAAELSVDAAEVEAGVKVRRSKKAVKVLGKYPQMSLLQAAELAEFERDPAAYTELVDTLAADPEGFDHTVAKWRLEYRLREARERLRSELCRAGVEVVEGGLPVGALRLERLYRSRKDRTRLDAADAGHESCPGHAAYVSTDNAEGAALAVYICRDWAAHGHVDAWTVGSASPVVQEWTPEKKAERARVVRNNKEWRAAETVRHANLGKLLARSTPPRLAGQFIAHSLVVGGHELRRAMEQAHPLACRLLGLKEPRPGRAHPLAVRLRKANANQTTMISLAVLLAAFEMSTSVATWRNPTAEQQRYFAALADWGVRLHWVERLVTDPKADAGIGVELALSDADVGMDRPADPAA